MDVILKRVIPMLTVMLILVAALPVMGQALARLPRSRTTRAREIE
jgi:hypothetical protein